MKQNETIESTANAVRRDNKEKMRHQSDKRIETLKQKLKTLVENNSFSCTLKFQSD